MTPRERAIAAIIGERDYQESIWNNITTSSEDIHSNLEFLVYIRDYVEEALHFCSRNGEPTANNFAKNSLRKIAALAVSAMEQNGTTVRNLEESNLEESVKIAIKHASDSPEPKVFQAVVNEIASDINNPNSLISQTILKNLSANRRRL